MAPLQQLKRVNFFAGQLLSAQDLQQEQAYHLDRWRRHNRFLHGWGIVAGLGVKLQGPASIVVEPGLAIDCAGNELVLASAQPLSLSGITGRHYVVMRYLEIPGDETLGEEPQPSRIREAVVVELVAAHPGAGHRAMGPGTPGCGLPHALTLATLGGDGSRWRVAASPRGGRRR